MTYLGKYITDDRELKATCARLYYQALGLDIENSATETDRRP